jgi:2-polyprenyl-3-methyl-5-hydroxy-6-metoxy-1,4-benzoquinol methylase
MNDYDSYLSDYLSGITDLKSRNNKKLWIAYNYNKYLPKDKNSKILEIGPGFGELLEFLIDNQYHNIQAIDLSQEVVDLCNGIKPGCAVKVDNTISFLKKNIGTFSMIILFQVLEHIPKKDVVDFLCALRSSLCENGKIIIEVPNIANIIVGVYSFFSDFTHEVAYTRLSLNYVLNMAKFSEIKIYELKVPLVSVKRIIQVCLQKAINTVLLIINKIYLPSQKHCLSATIFAVVKK